MSKEKTGIQCPNCGAAAIRMEKDGAVLVVCEKEDAVFALTRTGAKLRKVGALDELDRRVSALEGKTAPPAEKPDDVIPEEPPDDDDDDDDDGMDVTIIDDEDDE